MAWRRDECGTPKASEGLGRPSSSHPPAPPLGCLAAGPGLAWEAPGQPGAGCGRGLRASRPGPAPGPPRRPPPRLGLSPAQCSLHVPRCGLERPREAASRSPRTRPSLSLTALPTRVPRPRAHVRFSSRVRLSAAAAAAAGGPRGAAADRPPRAGRPTMEADGAGEQMRPLLTRVTRRVRAAGLLGRRARGSADKGWGAAGRPQVPGRAPPPQAAGAPGQPLCVTARSWGRAARRQGGRCGGPAARRRHPGCRVPGSRHPGGPAARGLGRSTAGQAPPCLRGACLSFPAFSPPGLGSSGLGAGLEVRPSINPSSSREEERGPTWLSHRPW